MKKQRARKTYEPLLTPDAQAALERAGFTRRSFLKGAGALIVSFSMAGVAEKLGGSAAGAMQQPTDPRDLLDSWIAIGADGHVTAYAGKVELGQGIATAQTQLVAEELYVPISRVTLIYGDTALTPDQGVTAGSQSHPTNFNPLNPSSPGNRSLLTAAASAREALLQLASERLGVPIEQLTIADGVISVKSDPSKKVSYGELIGGKRFDVPVNPNAKPKDPREWTVRGTPVPRLEIPAMVTGRFQYVGTVRVPGMVHGRVVRPPVIGATLISIDNQSEVEQMPGNVKVVRKGTFVGVVADTQWAAQKAAEALKVTWKMPDTPLPPFSDFYQWLRSQPLNQFSHTRPVDSGDIDEKFAGAAKVIRATYYHPYQMHASMGASVAVADVRGDQATIWCASQNVYAHRDTAARILGIPASNIRVVFRTGTGCYGLNGADTVGFDAAILSQAVGKPVRVQLSRKDEMAWENYGPAYVIEQRAAVDAQGNIIAWDHESWTLNRGGRPNANNPGNVPTGYLVGFPSPTVTPSATIPNPPQAFPRNGSNHVPSYVTGRGRDGVARYLGTVDSQRVIVHTLASPFFTGPLRSPARLQNTFVHESFMDEIAAAVGADPVEFRLRHLNNVPPTEEISGERLKAVIRAAAQAAGWDPRPSPKPGNPRTGVVTGRGIAACLYEGDNGYCAVVAEVEVDQDTGVITPKRFFVGHDCGPITNPDGLRNQIEGGIYQGMSRALVEEVTWDRDKITSVDWITYPVMTFGHKTPEIVSVLIDRRDVEAMGAGETTITVVAAAIGNAVFDATGARLRQIPFTPERVKAALAARR